MSSSVCRGSAQARAASRRSGSGSHFRNLPTAVSEGSPVAAPPPGSLRASMSTSSGSRPDRRSTSSMLGSSVTPWVASSVRASSSEKTSRDTSVTCPSRSPQTRVSRRSCPASTICTLTGRLPYSSPKVMVRSQVSRTGPVLSYTSKNSTTRSHRSATSARSSRKTGARPVSGFITSCTSSWLRRRVLSIARTRSAPSATCCGSTAPVNNAAPGTSAPRPARPTWAATVLDGDAPAAGAPGLVPALAIGGQLFVEPFERVPLPAEPGTDGLHRLQRVVHFVVHVRRDDGGLLAGGGLPLPHQGRLPHTAVAAHVEEEREVGLLRVPGEGLPEHRQLTATPHEPRAFAPSVDFLT